MRTDPMMIPTLLYLLKATAILLLTLGVAFLLRRAAAGTRHLVWLTAVATIVTLPVIAAALPDLRVLPIVPDAPAQTAQGTGAAAQPGLAGATDATAPSTDLLRNEAAIVRLSEEASPSGADQKVGGAQRWLGDLSAWTSPIQPVPALLLLWLAGTLFVLSRLALSAHALRRILATATPLDGADWTTPLYEAADRLNLGEAPRLLQSDRVAMPFACGLLRPTIVVPESSRDWTSSRRRAVLFHELAHIRRRDLLGHALGRIACALYWMHPLVWAAAYRLRAESERACDDLVLATGTPASEYADHLLQILVGVRANDAPAVALPMGRRREFEGRLLAILDPALRRRRPTLGHALVLAAFSLSAAALVAVAPADASAPSGSSGASPDHAARGALTTPSVAASQNRAATQQDQQATPPRPPSPVDPAPALTTQPAPAPLAEPAEHLNAVPHGFAHAVERLATDFGEGIGGLMGSLAASSVQMVLGTSSALEKDIPLLARLLATDPSAEVRRTAAWALYGTDDDRATAALVQAVNEDQSAEVREMSAWALHDRIGQPAVAALIAATGDADAHVRATAVWSLAHVATPGVPGVSALVARLGDADPEVRVRAAWGIGRLHPTSAPPPLYQSALMDENDDVQVAAAWALTQIVDPAARPALTRALQTEKDAEVLDALARALFRLGPVEPEALTALLASENPELRAQAIRMLAGAGTAIHPWPWPWPEPRPLP